MKKLMSIILLLIFVFAPALSSAEPTGCPQHFFGGRPPELVDRHLAAASREVCFRAFAVLHSGITRTPIWSSERLTSESVIAARGVERNDDFHPESRLPPAERSELADYRGSHMDRGHLTPNSDVGGQDDEQETFSLANIVPQHSGMNRGLWSAIENSVRNLAVQEGELWVVTGVIFGAAPASVPDGRVRVPDHLWKAIYDPRATSAGAYIAANAAGGEWRPVTLVDLDRLSGVAVFPGLPKAIRLRGMQLPEPSGKRR